MYGVSTRADAELVARERVASREDPTWAIGCSGPEVHEVVYTGGCGRRGGIVDVHTGVRRHV